jgi:chloride channel 3/4/5
MNAYPFLDSKLQPTSDAVLGDIVRPVRKNRVIDITDSPFLLASDLRIKLEHLLMAGELDSGLPILDDGVLTGLIPAPDLEYALDNLNTSEDRTLCIMSSDASVAVYDTDEGRFEEEDFNYFIDHVSQGYWTLRLGSANVHLGSDCA